MAESAELDLQVWVIAVFRADAGVTALVGQQVADEIPAGWKPPYLRVDAAFTRTLPMGCVEQAEIDLTVLAITEPRNGSRGKAEVYAIVAACRAAVRAASMAGAPARPTWAQGGVKVSDARVSRDADGIRETASMNVRALLSRDT